MTFILPLISLFHCLLAFIVEMLSCYFLVFPHLPSLIFVSFTAVDVGEDFLYLSAWNTFHFLNLGTQILQEVWKIITRFEYGCYPHCLFWNSVTFFIFYLLSSHNSFQFTCCIIWSLFSLSPSLLIFSLPLINNL